MAIAEITVRITYCRGAYSDGAIMRLVGTVMNTRTTPVIVLKGFGTRIKVILEHRDIDREELLKLAKEERIDEASVL